MKTVKMILPVAALFISALAFGQKSNKSSHSKLQDRNYQATNKKQEARTNGATNANQHANTNAQQRANENSVLNGTTTTTTKSKYTKRKSGTKRKTK